MPHRLCRAALLGALVAVPAFAQEGSPASWVTYGDLQADHELETDLDGGGSFDVTRFRAEAGLAYMKSPRDSLGLGLVLRQDAYDFGGAGFGALDPWDDIREISVTVPYRWGATDSLDVLVAGALTSRFESGADVGDGLTGSLIAGVSWRVSDSLSVGPGVGVSTELEDDASFFPFLLLDWSITDSLSLSTRGAGRAVDGPQAVLSWRPADAWSVGLGAGYESIRFRLDDGGPAPDGIGEEEAYPVFLSVAWGSPRSLQVVGFAGWKLGGELTLEDSNGRVLRSTDYDEMPFAGAGLRFAF